MRKLWRTMRDLLPQLPVLKKSEMCKARLSEHFLNALGMGWAPQPEWGCPEGIPAFMGRLEGFVRGEAARRGCEPRDLRIPLS